MNAFGRGFGWGAVGGAAFKGVHGIMSNANATAGMQGLRSGSWGLRQLTRPGLVGAAATMGLPTGAPKAQVAQPGLAMSNIPGMD